MKIFIILVLIIGMDRVAPESTENSAVFPFLTSRNLNERNIVMPNRIPITEILNNKFSRLKPLFELSPIGGGRRFRCLCDCGRVVSVYMNHLRRGVSKSCGCYQMEKISEINSKHKQSFSRIYSIWQGMKARCNNPKRISYKNYGGRGISLCREWEGEFVSFYNWAVDNGYKTNLTIDRINNDGNYEPSNCRWITIEENVSRSRGHAKLTPVDVINIKNAYLLGCFTHKEIASGYNVSPSTISMILTNKNWAWI